MKLLKSDDIEIKNDKKIAQKQENGYSGRSDKLPKTSITTASFATTLFLDYAVLLHSKEEKIGGY